MQVAQNFAMFYDEAMVACQDLFIIKHNIESIRDWTEFNILKATRQPSPMFPMLLSRPG